MDILSLLFWWDRVKFCLWILVPFCRCILWYYPCDHVHCLLGCQNRKFALNQKSIVKSQNRKSQPKSMGSTQLIFLTQKGKARSQNYNQYWWILYFANRFWHLYIAYFLLVSLQLFPLIQDFWCICYLFYVDAYRSLKCWSVGEKGRQRRDREGVLQSATNKLYSLLVWNSYCGYIV
jgi:hypothetical protein